MSAARTPISLVNSDHYNASLRACEEKVELLIAECMVEDRFASHDIIQGVINRMSGGKLAGERFILYVRAVLIQESDLNNRIFHRAFELLMISFQNNLFEEKHISQNAKKHLVIILSHWYILKPSEKSAYPEILRNNENRLIQLYQSLIATGFFSKDDLDFLSETPIVNAPWLAVLDTLVTKAPSLIGEGISEYYPLFSCFQFNAWTAENPEPEPDMAWKIIEKALNNNLLSSAFLNKTYHDLPRPYSAMIKHQKWELIKKAKEKGLLTTDVLFAPSGMEDALYQSRSEDFMLFARTNKGLCQRIYFFPSFVGESLKDFKRYIHRRTFSPQFAPPVTSATPPAKSTTPPIKSAAPPAKSPPSRVNMNTLRKEYRHYQQALSQNAMDSKSEEPFQKQMTDLEARCAKSSSDNVAQLQEECNKLTADIKTATKFLMKKCAQAGATERAETARVAAVAEHAASTAMGKESQARRAVSSLEIHIDQARKTLRAAGATIVGYDELDEKLKDCNVSLLQEKIKATSDWDALLLEIAEEEKQIKAKTFALEEARNGAKASKEIPAVTATSSSSSSKHPKYGKARRRDFAPPAAATAAAAVPVTEATHREEVKVIVDPDPHRPAIPLASAAAAVTTTSAAVMATSAPLFFSRRKVDVRNSAQQSIDMTLNHLIEIYDNHIINEAYQEYSKDKQLGLSAAIMESMKLASVAMRRVFRDNPSCYDADLGDLRDISKKHGMCLAAFEEIFASVAPFIAKVTTLLSTKPKKGTVRLAPIPIVQSLAQYHKPPDRKENAKLAITDNEMEPKQVMWIIQQLIEDMKKVDEVRDLDPKDKIKAFRAILTEIGEFRAISSFVSILKEKPKRHSRSKKEIPPFEAIMMECRNLDNEEGHTTKEISDEKIDLLARRCMTVDLSLYKVEEPPEPTDDRPGQILSIIGSRMKQRAITTRVATMSVRPT